ncbi:lipocalin-like domain-containing protein [Spirosoma aerophilum]
MKHYVYVLCLVVALTGLSSCNKSNDPEPVSPVVGRWELNRGLLSGFVSPYQNLNALGIDLYNYDFGSYTSRIDIRSDKSFTDNYKSGGLVNDGTGTWDYTNSQLTLNYDDGTKDTYTYTLTKGVEEIASAAQNITFPVSSTGTAPGKLQYVYRK